MFISLSVGIRTVVGNWFLVYSAAVTCIAVDRGEREREREVGLCQCTHVVSLVHACMHALSCAAMLLDVSCYPAVHVAANLQANVVKTWVT